VVTAIPSTRALAAIARSKVTRSCVDARGDRNVQRIRGQQGQVEPAQVSVGRCDVFTTYSYTMCSSDRPSVKDGERRASMIRRYVPIRTRRATTDENSADPKSLMIGISEPAWKKALARRLSGSSVSNATTTLV
jgi:hypothetical protein